MCMGEKFKSSLTHLEAIIKLFLAATPKVQNHIVYLIQH